MTFNNVPVNGWPQLKDLGGEGGVSDYEELSNLPKINSVELKGNKSLSDLGIDADSLSYDNTESGLTADDVQGAIDEMVTNFGAGVDSVYNACVSAGSTPASKSPADIATAIGNIGGNIPVYLENGLLTSSEGHHNTINLSDELTVGDVLIVSYKDGNDTFSQVYKFTGNNDEVNFSGYSIRLTSATATGFNLSGNWRDIYGKIAGVDPSQIYTTNNTRKRGKK